MLAFIGVTILMVINLVIYHKIFNVLYFDLGKGLLKEVVGAYIIACIELGVILQIGGSLLGGLLGIFGWILRLALIIGAVILAICIVSWIAKMIKEKTNSDEKTDGMSSPPVDASQRAVPQNIGSMQKKVSYCAYCGKPIADDSAFCNFCGKEKWARKSS